MSTAPFYNIRISETPKFNGFNACIIFHPDLEYFVNESFGSFFEIEFLSGERVIQDNGNIEQRFNCPKEKELIIRDTLFREQFNRGGPGLSAN